MKKLSALITTLLIISSLFASGNANNNSHIHHLFWQENNYSEICTSFLVNISNTNQTDIKLVTNYHCILHQHENIGRFTVSFDAFLGTYQNRPLIYTLKDTVDFLNYQTYKWNDLIIMDAKRDWLKDSVVFNIANQSPVRNDRLTLTGFSKEYGGPTDLNCKYIGKMIHYPTYLETQSECHTNSASPFLLGNYTKCPDPHQMNTIQGKTISEAMLCEPRKIRDPSPSEKELNINFIGIKNPDSLGGMSGGPIKNKDGDIVGINSSTMGAMNINGEEKIIVLYKPLSKTLFNSAKTASGKIFLENTVGIVNGRIVFEAQAEACINSENLILGNYHLKSDLFEKHFGSSVIELDQNDKVQKVKKLDCD